MCCNATWDHQPQTRDCMGNVLALSHAWVLTVHVAQVNDWHVLNISSVYVILKSFHAVAAMWLPYLEQQTHPAPSSEESSPIFTVIVKLSTPWLWIWVKQSPFTNSKGHLRIGTTHQIKETAQIIQYLNYNFIYLTLKLLIKAFQRSYRKEEEKLKKDRDLTSYIKHLLVLSSKVCGSK